MYKKAKVAWHKHLKKARKEKEKANTSQAPRAGAVTARPNAPARRPAQQPQG